MMKSDEKITGPINLGTTYVFTLLTSPSKEDHWQPQVAFEEDFLKTIDYFEGVITA